MSLYKRPFLLVLGLILKKANKQGALMKKQELDVNLINSNIIADENYSFSDILKSVNLFGQLQPIIVKKDKKKLIH